ncbi:MAG: hypothetical protein KGZ72_13470 [Roseovarius sp.]|jgi:Na+-transporting NADH:ubiquinone oxidoreductase subunit NqrC|nr:hypothetical protein [Roseovarius sp.]
MKPLSRERNGRDLRGTSRQRGATLIVAVIVLMLITMTVISAFRVSKSHTQAVANVQFRDEALAAANLVMEDVISLPNVETLKLADGSIPLRNVDINLDGINDFQIALSAPKCIREEAGSCSVGCESDQDSPQVGSQSYVLWEIEAEVTDVSTGANVSVVQGFRQQVSTVPASCN